MMTAANNKIKNTVIPGLIVFGVPSLYPLFQRFFPGIDQYISGIYLTFYGLINRISFMISYRFMYDGFSFGSISEVVQSFLLGLIYVITLIYQYMINLFATILFHTFNASVDYDFMQKLAMSIIFGFIFFLLYKTLFFFLKSNTRLKLYFFTTMLYFPFSIITVFFVIAYELIFMNKVALSWQPVTDPKTKFSITSWLRSGTAYAMFVALSLPALYDLIRFRMESLYHALLFTPYNSYVLFMSDLIFKLESSLDIMKTQEMNVTTIVLFVLTKVVQVILIVLEEIVGVFTKAYYMIMDTVSIHAIGFERFLLLLFLGMAFYLTFRVACFWLDFNIRLRVYLSGCILFFPMIMLVVPFLVLLEVLQYRLFEEKLAWTPKNSKASS